MTRITQSMMHTQLLRNLNNNMGRMDQLMKQLSSGRTINKPSDDPVGITMSLRYRSELELNDRYQSNAESALSWLEYTDMTLDQAGDVIQRFRELTIKAANDTNDESALHSIKSEMEELYDQLVTIGNSNFNGKYVFNGQMTDVEPYADDQPMNQATDDALIMFEVGVGVRMNANVTGNEVFGAPDDATNLFQAMQDVMNSIDSEQNTIKDRDLINDAMGRLDERQSQFLEIRADVGAKVHRVELSLDRLKDINMNLQDVKSSVEDADMAYVLTNLMMSENVYQASLAAGARLISPSLIDFLR